jgi:transcriptional regulator with GAF, ATPase, and Fis domain
MISSHGRRASSKDANGDRDVDGVVYQSPVMRTIISDVETIARSDIAVLLSGETGSGKDTVAHLIHHRSKRSKEPFIVINCSTLRGELLASELFGHKKGAFTGALQDQTGLIASAEGGTLFLDEIGEMDASLQAMLLRVLESGKVRPLGGASEFAVDVRLICATNRDLPGMIERKTFREDLFYRVGQYEIAIPPLRERGEDAVLLANHFLEKLRRKYPEKEIEAFDSKSITAIRRYDWPGNVRQLFNVVHRGLLRASSPYVELDIPEAREKPTGLEHATLRFQKEYVFRAITACGGNKNAAAKSLGIAKSTLFRYLIQFNQSVAA